MSFTGCVRRFSPPLRIVILSFIGFLVFRYDTDNYRYRYRYRYRGRSFFGFPTLVTGPDSPGENRAVNTHSPTVRITLGRDQDKSTPPPATRTAGTRKRFCECVNNLGYESVYQSVNSCNSDGLWAVADVCVYSITIKPSFLYICTRRYEAHPSLLRTGSSSC